MILKEVEKGKDALKFEDIDHTFYDRFRNHMIKKRKLTNNTIGKYVSTFKTFLSWAVDRGAPVHPAYRKFKVDEEDVEVVALTWDELQLLEKVDLSANPRLDRVRDLFLLECYTGARFGDIQTMHYDDIRDGVWCLRQQKTKTEVRIHISKRADAIITKYRSIGSPLPSISSQKFNGYIKELGKVAKLDSPFRQVRRSGKTASEKRGPKWEFLSSHVARKTFVSISLERGMRHEVVMSFTGHRSFKTMKKYIALTEKGRKEDVERVWG
ncbi:MAG: site-specific integrase [Ignavibacteria bacterium]|nr:site-specific integrase [Ignavibacteria bacterium]